ncbi:MAG: type II toxin-antitoxin system VapC family toxin [Rhizobiaceae bacterium]|nr:MAG: type II toxin-antitoxin system VapC family toxin [Rhizobiaceae bacterium]
MYVDSSAIVAIILNEPDAEQLLRRLMKAREPFTSVVTKVEASLALRRLGAKGISSGQMVSDFLKRLDVKVVAAEPSIFDSVMEAAARYGKGTGHPAKLNFGDCFSYAYAKQAGVPLLYKGNDFAKTDLAGS